jgi:hypothetical protein
VCVCAQSVVPPPGCRCDETLQLKQWLMTLVHNESITADELRRTFGMERTSRKASTTAVVGATPLAMAKARPLAPSTSLTMSTRGTPPNYSLFNCGSTLFPSFKSVAEQRCQG